MRVQMPKLPENRTMIGEQVARVIESRDDDFPVGAHLWGYFGWRNFTIFNVKYRKEFKTIRPYILEEIPNISWSSRIGVLSFTG